MKKYIWIPAMAVLLAACGGDSKETTEGEKEGETTENEELDLSETNVHTLDANGTSIKVHVPKEYVGTVELPSSDTCIEEGIIWQVRVGDKYVLHVEEADGSGNYIKKEKDRLTGTGIYKLTYLVDDKDLMMYKADLVNESGQKPFYHVFGVVKIDGRDYILKSFEQGDFNEGQARKMLTSIKAIKQGA